jgi:hypothetical protein
LSKQVQAKGLTSAQNPDLIINVKASHKKVQDVTTSMNYGWGWGRPWGWGGGFGMGIRTNNYNSGTIVIDIIDAKTQNWSGKVQRNFCRFAKVKTKTNPASCS